MKLAFSILILGIAISFSSISANAGPEEDWNACKADEGFDYAIADAGIAACSRLIKSTKEKTDLASAFANRCRHYETRLKMELAQPDCERAIQLDRHNALAFLVRGKVRFWKTNKYSKKSIEDFTTSIELNPTIAEAYYWRALSYGALGQCNLAIQDWSLYIKFKPDEAEAYKSRHECYYQLGMYDLALRDMKQAIKLEPKNSHYLLDISRIYLVYGDPTEGLSYIETAIQLSPDNGIFYEGRGVLKEKLGKREEALADYKKALQHDNSNRGIAERLKARGISID